MGTPLGDRGQIGAIKKAAHSGAALVITYRVVKINISSIGRIFFSERLIFGKRDFGLGFIGFGCQFFFEEITHGSFQGNGFIGYRWFSFVVLDSSCL